MSLPISTRVRYQAKAFTKIVDGISVTVVLRHDDRLNDGYNTFWVENAEVLSAYFPELGYLLKWNGWSVNGRFACALRAISHAAQGGERHGFRVWLNSRIPGSSPLLLGEFTDSQIDGVREIFRDFALDIDWVRLEERSAPDIDAARAVTDWPEASADQLRDACQIEDHVSCILQELKREIELLGMVY